MRTTTIRWKAILLCLLCGLNSIIIVSIILFLKKPQIETGTYTSYAYDVAIDNGFSEGEAVQVSLLDTGVYYLTLEWCEIEHGQYTVDNNGVAILTVDATVLIDGKNSAGYLIPIKGKQFMLLTRNGESHYVDKVLNTPFVS